MRLLTGALIALTLVATPQIPRQRLQPSPTLPSDLVLRVERVGSIPTHSNPTSPAVAGSRLLMIDQDTAIYVWDGQRAARLLGPEDAPQGVKPFQYERILNAASNSDGSKVYVVFISSSSPRGVPTRQSPRELSDGYYVLTEYAFDGNRLTSPKPLIALGARSEGHTGGGLTVLPDGTVLLAIGDNGDSYEDGRDYSQNSGNHLAKILRVDPAAAVNATVVAVGVRGAQRLILTGSGADTFVSFADPGGWVAEEVNAIRLSELLAGPKPANFGWGRHPVDKKSREGTFYIDYLGNSEAVISAPEPGFTEPIAQFGRDGLVPTAVSGPVASARSFRKISLLFGDLTNGAVYALTGPLSSSRQPVYQVKLVGVDNQPIVFKDVAGGRRPDPRFFNFPDGTAGVLLERTGEFYRLTEIQ